MKRLFTLFTVTAVVLSSFCGDDGVGPTTPPPDPTPPPSVNKELIVGSWLLIEAKTVFVDGLERDEDFDDQTLIFNDDLTFDLETSSNDATDVFGGDWSSTADIIILSFKTSGKITDVDQFDYDFNDDFIILLQFDTNILDINHFFFKYWKN